MSNIKENLMFTKTHEWIKNNDDSSYTLGITDYAQNSLGDIVFVELPSVGDSFSKEDEICVVESVKAASSIYAPFDLEIIAVNKVLVDEPDIINSSCYDDGWLIKFKTNTNLDGLLNDKTYKEILDS